MSTQDEDELRRELDKVISQYAQSNCWHDGNGSYEELYDTEMSRLVAFILAREQSIKQESEFFMGSHISTLMMPLLVHRLEKGFPSMTKEVIEEVHNKVQDYMKPFMERREKSLHSTNNSLEEK